MPILLCCPELTAQVSSLSPCVASLHFARACTYTHTHTHSYTLVHTLMHTHSCTHTHTYLYFLLLQAVINGGVQFELLCALDCLEPDDHMGHHLAVAARLENTKGQKYACRKKCKGRKATKTVRKGGWWATSQRSKAANQAEGQ